MTARSADSEIADWAESTAELEQLRHSLRRTTQALVEERLRSARLIEAVRQGARDGFAGLELRPVPAPKASRRRPNGEVATVMLSDWQLGKITPTYSSAVCAERVATMATKVVELTEIQRAHHPVDECRVWLLGDILEGEMIFPGQAHLIDASLFSQVVSAVEILERFLRTMLANFSRVSVVGVIGNHGSPGGRQRRDYHPETNFDRLAYQLTSELFARAGEKRIAWAIPQGGRERSWYAVDAIGAYRCLLFHGDQIRGHTGFPWYGFARKVLGWRSGAIAEPFDDAACGHWHTPTRMTLSNLTVRVNGSTESANSYAQEQMASMCSPTQTLLFVHPEKGRVTAEYTVEL